VAVIEHHAATKLPFGGYWAAFSLTPVIAGLAYVVAYPLLDWISYVEPFDGLDITPWNPQVGLSFVLILLFGRRTLPFLFIAPFVCHLVLNLSQTDLNEGFAHAAIIGGGYSAAALFLLRPTTRFDPALPSTRDLILLILTALASSAFVAVGFVATTALGGYLPFRDFLAAMLRYWVGDLIGVMVVTPFVLVAVLRKHTVQMSLEIALQFVAVAGALVLVLGFSEAQRLQLFYLLFLPIIWMALRNGLEGVTVGLLLTQLGLIIGVTLYPSRPEGITALQTLMLVLTAAGLIAGELVSEHRRAEAKLRLQQKALARVAQLGGLSELSVAIAHELNQPLTAARTYTRLVDDAVRQGSASAADIAAIAARAVAQVERAADVVRSLRALLRLDRGNRAICSVERLINEALALCEPELDQVNASVRVAVAGRLPQVLVDSLQIEQTLLNLIRNSIDAFKAASINGGAISVEAVGGDGCIEIRVADNGPGFPADVFENQFLPFSTTKAEGLGFGLVLCKTIVEAHGGRIWLDQTAPGALVHFTLPVTDDRHDE
jgi:two-component system, LuxR family, sensor kinase FixL